MSKTIDVEGGAPSGWPPKRGEGMSRRSMIDKPPPVVMAAAAVFGLILITGLLMAVSGKLGVANIKPQEVAVKINYITGGQEVITQPGFKLYIPFIQEIFIFDKTTQSFLMKGQKVISNNHVPMLTVRASDGSNFKIDDLSIQYEIMPSEALTLIDDSGPGDVYKEDWIKAHARSILRDEFGRYTAVEVADPTIYKQAPTAARIRMNEVLAPHGIRVTLIKTPNPQFDPDYESAIESRKEADQEVQRLVAKLDQLIQERAQRLAAVEREKTVQMQELQGELVAARRSAEADSIRIMRGADEFATERTAQGEGLMLELIEEARGLEAKYRKEAEGIHSKALALEERGEVIVREALIEKLLSITFTLIPYSRDPQPKRLEHIDGRGGVETMLDDSITGGQ